MVLFVDFSKSVALLQWSQMRIFGLSHENIVLTKDWIPSDQSKTIYSKCLF